MTSFFTAASGTRAFAEQFCKYLLIVVIAGVIFASFRIGLVRDFDDRLSNESWGRMLFGIGAAITQIDYGGYGYTVSAPVEGTLMQGGLTDDPAILSRLGTQFPDNLHDAKLIDTAIAMAARLPFPVSPDTGVRGATDDDVGLADYVTLSFRLFGHRLLGLYLFYFVVFISSVGIFLATFHRLARALVLLLAVCGAHVYVLGSNIFDPNYLGSLTDPRFLSVLGIVPGLHLACVLLFRLPLSRGNVAGAIAQSVILFFVVSVRSSAVWAAVAIVALGVVLLFSELWARKKLAPGSWGLAVLLTVGLVYTVHLSRSLHPVYKTDGALGYHGLWHALFYQLQQNRDWQEKYAASYGNAVGDTLPQMAAQKYVLQHPPSPSEDIYLTPGHTLMKPRARETYIRKAFLEFVANDPKFVIATLAGNVGRAGTVLMSFLRSLGRHPFQLGLIVAGAFMAGAAILASDAAGRRILAQAPLLLTGGFLVSLLPNLVSVQGIKLMSDPCLMLLATLIAWIVFGATEALRWAQTRFSHSGLSEYLPSMLHGGGDRFLQRCRPVLAKVFLKQPAVERRIADVDGGHGRG